MRTAVISADADKFVSTCYHILKNTKKQKKRAYLSDLVDLFSIGLRDGVGLRDALRTTPSGYKYKKPNVNPVQYFLVWPAPMVHSVWL